MSIIPEFIFLIIPEFIYKFNTIPTKTSARFFVDTNKIILNVYEKKKKN